MTAAAIAQWSIPQALLESPAVTNRDLLARKYADRPVDDILSQYIKMNAAEAARFYGDIFSCLSGPELAGVGVELGAGVGAFSAVCAKRYAGVERIYAVELVPDVVRLLQSRTVPAIAGEAGARVLPVIGSFDDLALPADSVDFCIEFASLHHSDDLGRTCVEVARVLKRGARLVAVDRAHHDALTDAQREFMLEVEYSGAWKASNGYDSARLTRRMNGEHELRLREWHAALGNAGLEVEQRVELRSVSWQKWAKTWLLCLPFGLRRSLDLWPSRARPHAGELLWMLGTLLGLPGTRPGGFRLSTHDYSIFVARKK